MKCNERDSTNDAMLKTKEKKYCKSKREIKRWLSDKLITLLVKEKVVDYDNYEQPLREVLNPLIRHKFVEASTNKILGLVRSKTEFRDSIFSGFISNFETNTEFLTVKSLADLSHGLFNNTYTV